MYAHEPVLIFVHSSRASGFFNSSGHAAVESALPRTLDARQCRVLCTAGLQGLGQLRSKESGGHVHADSGKLGSKSGFNDSRDFWRFNDIGAASWHTKPSDQYIPVL